MVTFEDSTINAGDLPLLTVGISKATIANVEVIESTKGSAPFVNEVQQLIVTGTDGSFRGGMFDVSFRGDRTSLLSVNISATDLEANLNALPSIRDGVVVSTLDRMMYGWTVAFASPGPQPLLTSSCETNRATDALLSDCILNNSAVETRRVVHGVTPASGTFRLKLTRADGTGERESKSGMSTTILLPTCATANEVQNALNVVRGGAKAEVSIIPNARAEYGLEWVVTLNDDGVHLVEVVDADIFGPALWCADGKTGPAAANTPCEFPFAVGGDEDQTHFTCAGAAGSNLGWCSTSPTFDSSSDWGGCTKCTQGALAPPTIHVASRRRTFQLIGSNSDVSRALSEVVYYPRPHWNAWLGGHDEVSAYWSDESNSDKRQVVSSAMARTVSHVFVAPVNDPPTVTLKRKTIVIIEGEEVLLDDAEIGDLDLVERPEGVIQLSLEAELGTLAFGNSEGLLFLSGTSVPHSSRRLVIKGPLTKVQVAMRQLYYRLPRGFAAGAASGRAVREIQRIEVIEPATPMVQSIATSADNGYIEGTFTLALACDAFVAALKDVFPDADLINGSSMQSYKHAVRSPPLAADAPATGNSSVEVGVRTMLSGCISYARNIATVLAEELSTNSSSAQHFAEDMLPHHTATAVVSRADPDLHGGVAWMVTLVDVPASLPAFDTLELNLTAGGAGVDATPYVYDGYTSTASPSVSVVITELGSSASGAHGTFTLAVPAGGHPTKGISASATSEQVAEALSALPDIGAVRVSTGPLVVESQAVRRRGRYWEVTFLPSGSPPHAGDLPLLIADGAGIQSKYAMMRVSEVTKGKAPKDSVSVVVNDLGNVGSGETLDVTAVWNITVAPQDSPPDVRVNGMDAGEDFLRGLEGTEVHLPEIEFSHVVAWATATEESSQELHYLARLSCTRGIARPTASAIGRDVSIEFPSPVVTELSGTLSELNRALSRVVYYAPTRYRGVDDVTIGVRIAGAGVEGGWGSAMLNVLVDGVNTAPELSAPRALKAMGDSPTAVRGISVADDDPEGIITLKVEAIRGVVSIPSQQLHRLLDVQEVRASTWSVCSHQSCDVRHDIKCLLSYTGCGRGYLQQAERAKN